jgi:DNA-binding GntR family transcriptional regulator
MPDEPSLRLPSFAHRTSLREQVADALRAAVVSGAMKPGGIYSAPALAAQFGVSATPVREAMLDLAKQGLVEVIPNKGFQVTKVSDAELDQITEIRLWLEPPAAAAAVTNARPDDVDTLTRLARTGVDVAAQGDLISYLEADLEFHSRLLALTGNRRLVDIVTTLRSQTRLYGLSALVEHGMLAASAKEHLAMCELLAAGDAPGLRQLVRRHIGHVRREWAGFVE